MYENITYSELKSLSDEQKKVALTELQARFGNNKAIAKELGTAAIAISNMVKKYVTGEHVGRYKEEDDMPILTPAAGTKFSGKTYEWPKAANTGTSEISGASWKSGAVEAKAVEAVDVKPRRTYNKRVSPGTVIESQPVQVESSIFKPAVDSKSAFSIFINKSASGESAQYILNGIGNTLIKDQRYLIELKISEK